MASVAVLAALLSAIASAAPAPTPAPHGIALGGTEGVIELKDALSPYQPPAGAKPDDSLWYMFTAANDSKRPAIRVFHAGQTPDIGLDLIAHATRPAILQIASTDPNVVIERAHDYGRRAFRVTIPASSSAAIAVRIAGAHTSPSLLAWTEPALAAHNRRLAIFVAAVAGLVAAAAAIAAGLAAMTHHAPPRWAAITLALMLLTRLAEIGLFDGSIVTPLGGPYGLTALFAGLALAAGARLTDFIVPLKESWPWIGRWLRHVLAGIVGISVLAYLGVPACVLLTDIVVVLGSVAIAVHLVQQSRKGSKAARAMAPSAVVFAFVCVAAACTGLGLFGSDPLTPDVAGGFAAAGAVLLTLAMATGEGVGVLTFARLTHVASGLVPPPAPAPIPHAAIEAIGAARQGVFELDFSGETVVLSREAAALLGLGDRANTMRHAIWMARIHPDDRPVYEQAIGDFRAQSGTAFRIEFRVRDEDGRYLWFELRATMKGNEGAPAERCVGLLADITVRKETEAEMMDRSLRDPLTGLGNRVALMEELEKLGENLNHAAFALIDIDRFKIIHASLGDAGGDEVLLNLADRLTKRFGAFAHIFRAGGDCFAVLLKNANGQTAAFGAELVAVCGAAHQIGGRNVFAPASAGVTEGHQARDPLDLLKNAELALNEAKRQGGGCARLYQPGMQTEAPQDAVALESELRAALDAGEIEVFYQSIVRLADRTVAGFEALLRWRHPIKGLIAPSDFIAHSEESGLIVALGRFALQRAAQDLAQWQHYFPLQEALFVSVNLSRRQLFDTELESFLAGLLASAGVVPGSLKLEVTESAVAAAGGDLKARFERLRALGLGLAIDDFGTGLSSLSQLNDLPFDAVKIDKSFLSRHGGTESESGGDIVLSSVVAMSHDLKCSVIVEGVENEEDAARLTQLGCELAQGFLFSEPLSMQATLGYIARSFRA